MPQRARDPWFLAAVAMAYVAALLPIWWPRFLPLYDFPQHLAGIAVWRRLGDPGWHYQDFYTLRLVPVPYWGYYFPVALLSHVLPIEVANKVYLSLYAAALPASVLALGGRFERSPWLALLAFPVIFNYSYGFGFITFCAALPMALGTLAVLDRFLESPSAAGFGVLLVAALGTFFTHVLPWLLVGVCALPFLVAAARRWRRALAAGVALLPSLAVAIWDFRYAAQNRLFGMLPAPLPEMEGLHDKPIDALRLVGHRLIMGWPGAGDAVVVAVLGATWIALLLTTPRRDPREERRLRHLVPAACCAIATLGYLFLPFHLLKPLNWWNASCRLLTPAALFALILVRGPIEGRRRLILVPALAAVLVYPVLLARRELDVNRRFEGLVRLMDRVPRGSSTLTLSLGEASDPALDPEFAPFLNVHSLPHFLKGGYDPYQYRNGYPFRLITERLPVAPFWSRPEQFDASTMATGFDYVLTRNEARDGQLFGSYAARLPPPARDGVWRLYATRAGDRTSASGTSTVK